MNSTKSPERIAVRCPNWLGDLMMSTPFLTALAVRYPTARIDLIVKKGMESLPFPIRAEVLVYDKRSVGPGRFGRRLKNRRYDAFYVLPPSLSSAWMAFMSGASRRIGYPHGGRSLFFNEVVSYSVPYQHQHLANEYLQLIDQHYRVEQFPPSLPINDQWRQEQLKTITLPPDFVALAPGAMFGPAKRWPLEQVRLVTKLIRQRHVPVVIIGTRDDSNAADFLADGDADVVNLCGKTTLNQMVAILAQARLLISNDSGPMHVMAALKRPQIAIFGSTSLVWTGPLNPLAKVIYHREPCSPCFKKTCRFNHYNCLTKITVEEVAAAVYEAL